MELEKGLKPAAAAAVREAGSGPDRPPEQLDLLGMPAIRAQDGKEIVPAPRGAGRPPGSENVLTRRWRSYLLLHYPSPLEGLVALAALGVEDISKSLRCSLLEAMNIKIRCMEYSTAYLYPRLQATLYRNEGDPGGGNASRLILSEQEDFVELTPERPPGGAPAEQK